jgi:pimeloyl-ACP methyl ester carboxylesterase
LMRHKGLARGDAPAWIGCGMDEVEVDGLRIAYRRAGRGPALVLLHGAFGDSRAWRPQLEGLSDELTVIAWDAPGCGGSSDPPDTFGRIEYGDCLAGFLSALGLDRAHVLGLSFGSVLALELYRRHPAVPVSLVLASAYAGWAGSLPPEEVQERIRRVQRDLDRPPEEWIGDYLPTFFSRSVPQAVVDESIAMMLDTRTAGLRAALRAFGQADLRDVLPTIAVPTLLLYGADDQRSPGHVAEGLHARIPDSELVVLPGVGHDSNLEAPVAFNGAVRRFLLDHGAHR